jgi:hypothetical protein
MAPRSRTLAAPTSGPPQLVELRNRGGHWLKRVLGADAHAALLSELLHAGQSGFVEVVGGHRSPGGQLGRFRRSDMANFVRAGDREALLERVRELRAGERAEVFLTPVTLRVPVPGNDSVDRSAVAWVDIDDPRRLRTLHRFPHVPHAVIASGSGGVHAYWLLEPGVSGEQCEVLNRKLATALGADPASCNRGRILRVPGTWNWKPAKKGRGPAWCRVQRCDLAKPPYDPSVLGAGLRDPKAPRPTRRLWLPGSHSRVAPWDEMEAAEYYQAIVGVEPYRNGKIHCPHAAHPDRHPSARLYEGVGAGWYCFACQAGGSVIDLMAAIRGYPTGSELGGEQFLECIDELRQLFGVPESASKRGRES